MRQDEQNAASFRQAAQALCPRIADLLLALPVSMQAQVMEIRLRAEQPVSVWESRGTWFMTPGGPGLSPAHAVCARREDLQECFRRLCSHSVYSHEEQIRQGFLTLPGGHRAGLAGSAVCRGGAVVGMRDISGINIRIARQLPGSADTLFQTLGTLEGGLLLAGPPACGKTTLLRDIARQLSAGLRGPVRKVAVVDERGEIAGAFHGVLGSDLGPCCDVLDGFPKAAGMMQAVRVLSPEYLLCDELGGMQEAAALLESVNAGVHVIASLHAGSLSECNTRPQARALLESGAFQTIVLLEQGRPGRIAQFIKAGDLLAADRGSGAGCLGRNGGRVSAIA